VPADQPLHSTPAERQQWVEQQRQAAVATARRGHANTAHLSDAWEQRRWTSRLIHRLGAYAASADAAVCAAIMVLVWLFVGFLTGFPSWWATCLYSFTASITFVMVFAIQHANERHTAAIQRKLDELIRSSRDADDALIAVEEADDCHLQALAELNFSDRVVATQRTDDAG